MNVTQDRCRVVPIFDSANSNRTSNRNFDIPRHCPPPSLMSNTQHTARRTRFQTLFEMWVVVDLSGDSVVVVVVVLSPATSTSNSMRMAIASKVAVEEEEGTDKVGENKVGEEEVGVEEVR